MCQNRDVNSSYLKYFLSHHCCHFQVNSMRLASFEVASEVEQAVNSLYFVHSLYFHFCYLGMMTLMISSRLLLPSYSRCSCNLFHFDFSVSSDDCYSAKKKNVNVIMWKKFQIRQILTWLLLICAMRFWYKVAAITIASSGDWHTNPWHSSCFATTGDFITTAKSGECKPDDNLLLSLALMKVKYINMELIASMHYTRITSMAWTVLLCRYSLDQWWVEERRLLPHFVIAQILLLTKRRCFETVWTLALVHELWLEDPSSWCSILPRFVSNLWEKNQSHVSKINKVRRKKEKKLQK